MYGALLLEGGHPQSWEDSVPSALCRKVQVAPKVVFACGFFFGFFLVMLSHVQQLSPQFQLALSFSLSTNKTPPSHLSLGPWPDAQMLELRDERMHQRREGQRMEHSGWVVCVTYQTPHLCLGSLLNEQQGSPPETCLGEEQIPGKM